MSGRLRDLPTAVSAALDARLERLSRNPLKSTAEAISGAYRKGLTSHHAIRSPQDALVYALVRMPATYAAVHRSLEELERDAVHPKPATLLDIGSGTGGATLAVATALGTITQVHMVEPNPHLANLAKELVRNHSIDNVTVSSHDATRELPAGPFDIVTMSYVQVELSPEQAMGTVDAALVRARSCLILIEPGTTLGFARIRAARDRISTSGWSILAPCPHDGVCPMKPGDWCHFKVRLPRSRAHRALKSADAPFEDEPYSYVIGVPNAISRPTHRVLSTPPAGKAGLALDLCSADGRTAITVTRSDSSTYKIARKLIAGDSFSPPKATER